MLDTVRIQLLDTDSRNSARDNEARIASAAEPPSTATVQPIRRRGRLGGLLHEYEFAAA